jgi:light-regulated signal transduction histidine kinase (bacteriophytochrome)
MTRQPKSQTHCDLNKVVKRAIQKLKPTIEEGGAVVTHKPMPSLNADYPSMVVVLQNLILNGIKFRSKEPARVHISAQREGDEWVFSVADNGIGLHPAEAGRIFDVKERSRSGLSLAICKKIVENHGGRIWAESEPGAGSTFYFTLPG